MKFLVDTDNKIVLGWSAKCGCSHAKTIFLYLKTNNYDNKIHTHENVSKLPNDIENYTTIIISRNPYKRLVSGFLDKYSKNGEFRHLWKNSFLSFSQFVDELLKKWNQVEKHHFTPQTSEMFDKKILSSKIIKFYDICNIDYKYIEELYDKKIPEFIMKKQQGHERVFKIDPKKNYNNYVYDLNIDEYINFNVDIKFFYNQDIKKKVFDFYKEDFIFFKENGIDYTDLES